MSVGECHLKDCPICLETPPDPKILPCQHVYCIHCLEKIIQENYSDPSSPRLTCSVCRRPFAVLPKPAVGCRPLQGSLQQEFETDSYAKKPTPLFTIVPNEDAKNRKVMGLGMTNGKLYVVYHSHPTVYMYSTDTCELKLTARNTDIVWPRGLAVSRQSNCIYITDWSRMFEGKVWKMEEDGREGYFKLFANTSHQPFGVSVSSDDHVVVVCSTPLRRAILGIGKSNEILIISPGGIVEKTVQLPDCLDIPRHVIRFCDPELFFLCHGWVTNSQVVMVNGNGMLIGDSGGACYGSTDKSSDQRLNQPLCLFTDDHSIFVVDYRNSRIHILTCQLRLVRHLVTKVDDIQQPRHACLDNGILAVGQRNGDVLLFNVLQEGETNPCQIS